MFKLSLGLYLQNICDPAQLQQRHASAKETPAVRLWAFRSCLFCVCVGACRFIASLPNFSSSSDGGDITASVGSITLGASGGVSGQGSSTGKTPWTFAPKPVPAGGDCARVTASVTPTNDKQQVRGGPSLSGNITTSMWVEGHFWWLGCCATESLGGGSSTGKTPWTFALEPVSAGGDCALVTVSVTPTSDKVVLPLLKPPSRDIPAAGKVICNSATYTPPHCSESAAAAAAAVAV
jgi:hypothetical protein